MWAAEIYTSFYQVSYKWLSHNFLVSSNAAKRLLQVFVETHGSGIEIVYKLSGWLKNNPSVYHIRLVSRPKLAVFAFLAYFFGFECRVYLQGSNMVAECLALLDGLQLVKEQNFGNCKREANAAADCLAKLDVQNRASLCIPMASSLPVAVKMVLQQDRRGIPVMRKSFAFFSTQLCNVVGFS
ncbi:unnamed protein product [Ilex paraguariensis]|uniref:DNA polymerase delta subunit 3 n=1 Tax=Ilex paraguariensis TaxID=185542 RepID=A0ABC8R8K7_9AQUA